MEGSNEEPIPLACVPEAIPGEARGDHFALIGRLFGTGVQEREAVPDGYAFRFAPEVLGDLARFVSSERRCCPFLTFTLAIPAGEGSLWLRITGPVGTREFLDAELRS